MPYRTLRVPMTRSVMRCVTTQSVGTIMPRCVNDTNCDFGRPRAVLLSLTATVSPSASYLKRHPVTKCPGSWFGLHSSRILWCLGCRVKRTTAKAEAKNPDQRSAVDSAEGVGVRLADDLPGTGSKLSEFGRSAPAAWVGFYCCFAAARRASPLLRPPGRSVHVRKIRR